MKESLFFTPAGIHCADSWLPNQQCWASTLRQEYAQMRKPLQPPVPRRVVGGVPFRPYGAVILKAPELLGTFDSHIDGVKGPTPDGDCYYNSMS